jgi:sugar lactone lactonase YvrE
MKNLTKIPAFALALFIFGCSGIIPVPVNNTDATYLISPQEQNELDKEYLNFKTEALTKGYLIRKLKLFLTPPVKGKKLVNELLYGMAKHPNLVADAFMADMTLFDPIDDVPEVGTMKEVSASFRNFMIGVKPVISRTVTTIAGNNPLYLDALGEAASFNNPFDITNDGAGNFYVSDTNNNKIRKIDTAGNVTTIAGNGSFSTLVDGYGNNATFYGPAGLVAAPDGNIFVVDQFHQKIRKIDTNNNNLVSSIAGHNSAQSLDGTGEEAGFNYPTGITRDNAGNLYVTDTSSHKITKLVMNQNGTATVSTIAGTGAPGSDDGSSASFWFPAGIASDGLNALYVADLNNNKIRKVVLNEDGTTTTSTIAPAAGFPYPIGITYKSPGILYVTVLGSNSIKKIDLSNESVSNIAGSGSPAFANGTGTEASFNSPSGLTFNSNGDLFVADSQNSRIRKIVTTSGIVSVFAGSGKDRDANGTAARFLNSRNIVRDSLGNLYVADSGNNKIRKIDSQGNVTTVAGSGANSFADGNGTAAAFSGPEGIVLDKNGNIFVTDSGNNRIRKIGSNKQVITIAGNSNASSANGIGPDAGFNLPSGITIDNLGNLYVADFLNHKIRKIVLNSGATVGTVSTVAGNGAGSFADGDGGAASFHYPAGIISDGQNILYVADSSNHMVRKIVLNGDGSSTVSTIAGNGTADNFADGPGAASTFNFPRAIALDSNGNLYVADSINYRIRKIILNTAKTSGTVSTVAGNNTNSYIDAVGTNASFSYLFGITVDDSGNLYVVDAGNNRIRKVSR